MKSQFYKMFLFLSLIFCVACSDNLDLNVVAYDEAKIIYKGSILGPGVTIYAVNSLGEQYTLEIQNGLRNWTISCDADWISFSQKSGDRKAKVTIKINPLPEESVGRSAHIKIDAKNANITFLLELVQYGELNGRPYVDLGLPSGTLWAAYDIGTVYGTFKVDNFFWGQVPKETNKYFTENLTIKELLDRNIIDSRGNLTPQYDAATQNWGAPWRMPTTEDFEELLKYCTIEDKSINLNGSYSHDIPFLDAYLFIGPNKNRIIMLRESVSFFYWTSTACTDSNKSYIFVLDDKRISPWTRKENWSTCIRPVADKQ